MLLLLVTDEKNIFQSYQDDGRVIIKGCVQWNPVNEWRDFSLQWGLNLGLPVPNLLNYQGSQSLLEKTVYLETMFSEVTETK